MAQDVPEKVSTREGGEQSREIREQLSVGDQWEQYGRYPYLLAKMLFYGILIAGLVWSITAIGSIAFPLFLSLLLAYLLDPTVDQMERRGLSRTLAITILMIVGLAVTTVFSLFLYPTLTTQISKVSEHAPNILDKVQTDFVPWVEQTFHIALPPTLAEAFDRYGSEITEAFPSAAQKVGTWVTGLLSGTGVLVASLLNLVMIPIFTFYFLRDFDKGRLSVVRFIPSQRREFVISRLMLMDVAVGQWFRGQLQVAGILAVLYGVGLAIVFGIFGLDIQSGIVIGVLTGLLNVVPYFGFAIGSILALLVVLIDWSGWGALIAVGIVYGVIQTAESYFITPKIVGEKVGLNPVTVIIVLLIGGHIGGLLGVLLAIPISGAIKVILPDILAMYERNSFFTGIPMTPAPRVVYTHQVNVLGLEEIMHESSVEEVSGDEEAEERQRKISKALASECDDEEDVVDVAGDEDADDEIDRGAENEVARIVDPLGELKDEGKLDGKS